MSVITTFLLACLLVFDGCVSTRSDLSRSVTGDKPQTSPQQQPAKSDQTPDFLHSGIFDTDRQALEAWVTFIKDGRYRVASGVDFGFSNAAQKELEEMFGKVWYPRINHPAISGNIAREYGSKDLAVIVIDTTRSDASRFGLIIFNVPENGKPVSKHWLFRERDLSSALLSWHNNWPVLVFYNKDGSSDAYYINWDKKTKRYFLDKEQKGLDARKNSSLRGTVSP
jgi:hypothetical protein